MRVRRRSRSASQPPLECIIASFNIRFVHYIETHGCNYPADMSRSSGYLEGSRAEAGLPRQTLSDCLGPGFREGLDCPKAAQAAQGSCGFTRGGGIRLIWSGNVITCLGILGSRPMGRTCCSHISKHHKELSVPVVRSPPPTCIKAADGPSRAPVCRAGTERPLCGEGDLMVPQAMQRRRYLLLDQTSQRPNRFP